MRNVILIVLIAIKVVVTMPSNAQEVKRFFDSDDADKENDIGSPHNTRKGNFVTREEWQARSPREVNPLQTPVPFVVIHHSFIPPKCVTRDQCSYAMRTMQSMHVDDRKWADIGYNFAVGSDGDVYEGRGWRTLGAHALHFNTVSVGICLIGNWNDTLPPQNQLAAAKELIEEGARLGFLREDYKLVGHRQVRATECPGQALFEEIRTWPHYSNYTLDLSKI